MSDKAWTAETVASFALVNGLKDAKPEEIEHIVKLANKVAAASAAVPRVPSKGHEPASTFKVPL